MMRSQSSLLPTARREAIIDQLTAPLEQPRQTARAEIDRHVNCAGRCAICGTPYPCDRAELAELALGLF